MRKPLYDHNTG